MFDFVIVGAGFFGARLALLLARQGCRVALLERGATICSRASWNNQARIHNGYHYPRSLSTARGSHEHYERFIREMSDCVFQSFEHIYAIPRDHSATNTSQFIRFCRLLDLEVRDAGRAAKALLNSDLVEDAFCVREAAFDCTAVRRKLLRSLLEEPRITLRTNEHCQSIAREGSTVTVAGTSRRWRGRGVFIVAYAGINSILRSSGLEPLDLKAELAEVCLVKVPPILQGRGLTFMDGPFFSLMPFPAEKAHSLTHVRYTPKASWHLHAHPADPYRMADAAGQTSGFAYMRADARRFVPAIAGTTHIRSLFEVKAIPNRNEADDGRPILLRRHCSDPLIVSVLGSKFDSIFELEKAVLDLLESADPDRREDQKAAAVTSMRAKTDAAPHR
jgi:glycine/D-amino acid oxidase-like deaminating enzyme